jgi:hypothetical protein
MRTIETDWWLLDLPDEWEAEQDEETIIVGDEDGVGALEITTLTHGSTDVDFSDLDALAKEIVPVATPGKAVTLANMPGRYFQYEEEGDAVREWLITDGEILLLITYSCDIENAGLDDGTVDDILETLDRKSAADAD